MYRINSSPKTHKEKVLGIQKQVRDYQSQGDGKGMVMVWSGSGGSGSVSQTRSKLYPVSVNLVDVLDIDTERRVVR